MAVLFKLSFILLAIIAVAFAFPIEESKIAVKPHRKVPVEIIHDEDGDIYITPYYPEDYDTTTPNALKTALDYIGDELELLSMLAQKQKTEEEQAKAAEKKETMEVKSETKTEN